MTCACNPVGDKLNLTVAEGSSTPTPRYVVMEGKRAARAGAMIEVSTTAKRSVPPSGVGRPIVAGVAGAV
jgi:uncharacterized Zn-binding protein involved in type VI secretion